MPIRLVNGLPFPSTVHWHGVRVVNAMDGAAGLTQPFVLPGGTFDYRFLVPDAGTFWYHASCPDQRAARLLYGGLIVDEVDPVEVDRDESLVLDAWRPAAMSDPARGGPLDASGIQFSANGHPCCDIPIKVNERLRLRLINVAPDWVFVLAVDHHPVTVMAIDGEPAEPFEPREGRLMLGPGNRVDLFVDATLAPGEAVPLLIEQHGAVPLCRLRYDAGGPARPTRRPPPRPLPASGLPERMTFERAFRIELEIGSGATDRSAALGAPPLFSVRQGTTVLIALINRRNAPSTVHIHGHHVRLLDNLDDGWKPFWLDTVTLPGRQTFRLAFLADNPGKWLIEQHLFNAAGAAGSPWFEVT
jgi:FtsP/CotA-like multicopper oxidase with cupredoxin domain